MIVVASAGNEGDTAEPHIGSPADAFSVIAVGAVTSKKVRASFSSIGPSYDGRIKPDVMAQGQSTVLSDEDGNVVTSSGTSFSGPIIAGMTACLWQAYPNKTNQQIKNMILEAGDRYKAPTNQYGYGIPDFNLALTHGEALTTDASTNFFYIYPNPTSSAVTVAFPETFNKGKITFYSVYGQKVLENYNIVPKEIISLKTLENGAYFYKFEVDSFTQTGKIIKN
jgi:subtilisin family serine protease